MPISDRIKAAREKAGISRAELSRRLGITRAPITAWEKGDYEPSKENVRAIAHALGVELAWLLYGVGSGAFGDTISTGSIVARLKMQDIPRYLAKTFRAEETVRTHFVCSERAFATEIEDFSNAPRFMPGDRIVIDPDQKPNPGDMVLALDADGQPILARYTASGLDFINDDFKTERKMAVENVEIVGVMTEHAQPRRPR